MKRILAFALVGFAALPLSAAAQDQSASLDPEIAQCIRDNAPKVEAAVPDLSAAVDFLTMKVCAEPIAKKNVSVTKLSQKKTAAHWKDFCDKQKAAKEEKVKTKNTMANWCDMQNSGYGVLIGGGDDEDGSLYSVLNTTPPPSATALAAHLLLDLRLSHSNVGSNH